MAIPQMLFENPAGTPIRINTDYFGNLRSVRNPFPGPFEKATDGQRPIKVWPVAPGYLGRWF